MFHMNGFSENRTGHGVISYDSRETHKNGYKPSQLYLLLYIGLYSDGCGHSDRTGSWSILTPKMG